MCARLPEWNSSSNVSKKCVFIYLELETVILNQKKENEHERKILGNDVDFVSFDRIYLYTLLSRYKCVSCSSAL